MNEKFFPIKKKIKNDFSDFKSLKIILLSDTSTQFLVQAIRGAGYDEGLDLQILNADFNQIQQQVFDINSELYKFRPSIVILFQSSHKLLGKYNKLDPKDQNSLGTNELALIANLTSNIKANLSAKIIYYNYTELDDSVFGNFANKVPSSFLFQLRKLNYELMDFAANTSDFFICDLSSLQNQVGKTNFFRPSIYVNTEMVLSIDVLPLVAQRNIDIIKALSGRFKKCIILDLDNTIWGGTVGDDGLENIEIGTLGIGKAFSEFQYWIKQLKNRGIIVAICSKNTELAAKEPFEKHPEMVLRLVDISVFIANWENKADNIRQIQSILNIGFDSMVFLDDNPFERNLVIQNIPSITVPELPEDPAEYLEYLYTQNLFETVSFSKEDGERIKYYQVEAQRSTSQQQFTDVNDYLRSLDMYSVVKPFNKFTTPRVAQLSQRSNQFNLRTIRYTEADIEKLSTAEDYFTFSFTLLDKYGDNGLICAIILKKEDEETVFIDAWFMSCRVLKRGMENFTLNIIANFAKEKGFVFLKGAYLPTAKNEMVKEHYVNLGFKQVANYYLLTLADYEDKPNFIMRNN